MIGKDFLQRYLRLVKHLEKEQERKSPQIPRVREIESYES